MNASTGEGSFGKWNYYTNGTNKQTSTSNVLNCVCLHT